MLKRLAISFITTLILPHMFADIALTGSIPQEFTASPGQHLEGTIPVANPGTDTANVKIYKTDYRFIADGTNFFDTAGTQPRSSALWMDISPMTLVIPPGETAFVNFKIDVPADPNLSGSYWSMIMVEGDKPPLRADGPGMGIGQSIRYGIQICVTIGNTGTTKLLIRNPQITRNGEATTLLVDVKNDGERMVKPKVTVELFNPQGKSAGILTASLYRLYPGTEFRYQMTIPDDLPRMTYKALIIADCGENKVFGANVNLSLKP